MILIWNFAKSFVIMHIITRFIIQLTLIYTRSLSDDGLFGLFPGFEAFVDPRPQIGHLSSEPNKDLSHTDNWIWLLLWQSHQSVNRKKHLSYRCYQKNIPLSIWKVIHTKNVLLFLEDKLHDFLNWLLMCKKAFYLREL